MYIPNDDTHITPSVDYNYRLKLFDADPEVAEVVRLTNNKTLFKTLWTSVINRPMSPPSLPKSRYME